MLQAEFRPLPMPLEERMMRRMKIMKIKNCLQSAEEYNDVVENGPEVSSSIGFMQQKYFRKNQTDFRKTENKNKFWKIAYN